MWLDVRTDSATYQNLYGAHRALIDEAIMGESSRAVLNPSPRRLDPRPSPSPRPHLRPHPHPHPSPRPCPSPLPLALTLALTPMPSLALSQVHGAAESSRAPCSRRPHERRDQSRPISSDLTPRQSGGRRMACEKGAQTAAALTASRRRAPESSQVGWGGTGGRSVSRHSKPAHAHGARARAPGLSRSLSR